MGIGAGAASAAAIATSAASGIAGATGALMSGAAQALAAKYQSGIAQQNAALAKNNANIALAQGDAAVQEQYQAGAQKMGAERAAIGAGNIELGSGSALSDQISLARTTAQNVQNTQYNADTQAVGYLNQGAQDTAQSSIDMMTAANDTTAGFLGAGTSLLTSASQVSSKWAWMTGGGGPSPTASTANGT